MNLGFEVGRARRRLWSPAGDAAIEFWTEGIGSLPETWDRFIPDDPRRRDDPQRLGRAADARLERRRLAEPRHDVRRRGRRGRRGRAADVPRERAGGSCKLKDGSYAPVDPERRRRSPRAHGGDLRDVAGQHKKLPLSQAGRVQDLLAARRRADERRARRRSELFDKLADIGEIEADSEAALRSRPTLRDYQKRGFSWLVFLARPRDGRHPRRRHGPRQDAAGDRALALGEVEGARSEAQPGRRADLGRAELAARDREVRADARDASSGRGRTGSTSSGRARGRRRDDHELRAPSPRRGASCRGSTSAT